MTSATPAPGASQSPEPAPVGPAAAFSVTDLYQLLDDAVRGAQLAHLWVTGTVTGLRPGRKFTTFELVDYQLDGSTPLAVLSVGAFASNAKQIKAILAQAGTELADGLQVALWGSLDLNPPYGRMRLMAQRVDPRTSVGAVVMARDDLVAELDRTGRRWAQSRLSVPPVPRRIGLVSSPSAAGRADVFAVLERTPLPLEVVEAHAAMSGSGAPDEVARAIGLLAGARVDVILIARGGGAKSELAPWDSRAVAMAIIDCPVPIWTALGHSTDHSLADGLANACHPTPSAAAGALVARGEASVRAAEEQAQRQRHQRELAVSQARTRKAVLVAAVVVLVAIAVLVASRI